MGVWVVRGGVCVPAVGDRWQQAPLVGGEEMQGGRCQVPPPNPTHTHVDDRYLVRGHVGAAAPPPPPANCGAGPGEGHPDG
jgi:hypothetical protein